MNIKIPEGWEFRKLGEITEKIIDYRGKTPKKLGGDWTFSGYKVLSAKNIKTGKIVNQETIRYIDEELYKKWMKEEVKKGDIFLTSEAPLGEVFYWDSDEKVVLGQRLFGIRVKPNINSRYIYYYFSSNIFQNELRNRETGTTATGIRQKELIKTNVILPPLPEQEKIADILGSIDDQIENLMEQNKTLEEIAKTIFKRWFIDFEFPNEEGKPYKSSGGEFIDSELGKIPKGWRVGTFGEFVDIVKGLSYKGKFLTEKSDVILINLKNVGLDGSFRYEGIKYYEGDYKAKHIVKSRDIVIAATDLTRNGDILANPILIPNLETNTAIISMDLSKLVIKETKYKWFLFFLMKTKSFKNFAKSYASGTTVLHLKLDELKKYKFPLPKIGTLELFYYLSDNIMNKIVVNNNQIQTLTQLRDTLLPKLITGQIRVKV